MRRTALFGQHLGHHLGIVDDLLLIVAKVLAQRLLEGHRLGGDDVHQRAALQAGKTIELSAFSCSALGQDHAAARAAQRLVCGRGHEMRVRHRVGVEPGGDQAGIVSDIGQQVGADFVGDLREALEIDAQGIRRGAGDDHLRLVLARQRFDLVVVDLLGVGIADRRRPR
jgi:hypothetical protein